MLVLVGSHLLSGVAVLLYCTHCKQLQRKDNGICPYCAPDIDRIKRCRIVPTMATAHILQQIHQGCRLPLQPSVAMPKSRGPTVAERIARAKEQGVCAPIVPHALYWDVPGTVGLLDGVKHRHAYIDVVTQLGDGVIEEQVEVFRLETGMAGRLFVQPEAFVRWAQNWHQGAAIGQVNAPPDSWLEVPLRRCATPHTVEEAVFAVWTYDALLMQDCLALDTLEHLPGHLPILGFEWGVTRVIPEAYKATYEMALSMSGSNPALALTWGSTEKQITRGSAVDFRMRRKLHADHLRGLYSK